RHRERAEPDVQTRSQPGEEERYRRALQLLFRARRLLLQDGVVALLRLLQRVVPLALPVAFLGRTGGPDPDATRHAVHRILSVRWGEPPVLRPLRSPVRTSGAP